MAMGSEMADVQGVDGQGQGGQGGIMARGGGGSEGVWRGSRGDQLVAGTLWSRPPMLRGDQDVFFPQFLSQLDIYLHLLCLFFHLPLCTKI